MFNERQRELGVAETKLYQFCSITFDWTSSNTGKYAGLGQLLTVKRKKVWEGEQEKNGLLSPLKPLLVKGCDDHLAALIATDFERRVAMLGQVWDGTPLAAPSSSSKRNGITSGLKKLSKQFRVYWKQDFEGFVWKRLDNFAACNPSAPQQRPPTFEKGSQTRYVSFHNLAHTVVKNKDHIEQFLNLKIAEGNETALHLKKTLFSSLSQNLLEVMAIGRNRLLLPMMKIAQETNAARYRSDMRQLLQDIIIQSGLQTGYIRRLFGCEDEEEWEPILDRLPHHTGRDALLQQLVCNSDEYGTAGDDVTRQRYALAREFVKAALHICAKHNPFMLGFEDMEQELRETIKATNRSGEGLFSLLNRLWQANHNIRDCIIESIARIRSSCGKGLNRMFATYADRMGTRAKGRKRLDQAPTRQSVARAKHSVLQADRHSTITRHQARQTQQLNESPVANYLTKHFQWSGGKLTVQVMKDAMRNLAATYKGQYKLTLGARRAQTLTNFLTFINWEQNHLNISQV